MPSGPIQTQPSGLLGLLNLKNMGRNPAQLADLVQPVWDLAELYMLSVVEDQTPDLSASLAPGAGGFTAWTVPAIVPPGEMWYVWNYTVLATCAAGDTVNGLRPIVRTSVAVTSQFARYGTDVASQAAAGRALVGAEGFWVRQGEELGIFAASVASAATVPCLGYIHFTRLPL